jgi:hypothetical protein
MSGLVTGGRDPNEDEWKQFHAAVKDGDGSISIGEASVPKPEIIKFNLSGSGSEYWGHWREAGGDHTAYVKENVPTFALVGALLLTQSLAMAVDPPDIDDSTMMTAFMAMTNTVTACSTLMLMFSIQLYSCYTNCINEETEMQFIKKFASWVIPLMAGLSIIIILAMMASIFIENLNRSPAKDVILTGTQFGATLVIGFVINTKMQLWNTKNIATRVAAVQMMKDQVGPLDLTMAEVLARLKYFQSSISVRGPGGLLANHMSKIGLVANFDIDQFKAKLLEDAGATKISVMTEARITRLIQRICHDTVERELEDIYTS